ncbi:MAG: ATP-dependent DNA helicase RecG [Bdellovibrionales bacterium]|nr:ATP-dependent DNA helicase RecG [Bdellovibrionales bacterium]
MKGLDLATPIQFLKGVGPKFAEVLGRRGIASIQHLIEWYPRGYEDRRAARRISDLSPGEIVSLTATIVAVKETAIGFRKRKFVTVVFKDETGVLTAKFFRTPYRGYFQRLKPGLKVRVIGKVLDYRGNIEFHHPDILDFTEESAEDSDRLIPLYTETEGLSPQRIRALIAKSLEDLKGKIPETLPASLLKEESLLSREQAIAQLHQPPRESSALDYNHEKSPAHQRMIFEEFFWLQLYLSTRKSGEAQQEAPALECSDADLERISKSLPFQLTDGQLSTLSTIRSDLARKHPMTRLVQGDVGSGKTVVALVASFIAAQSGAQTAIMVPTEILADQHFKTALRLLSDLGIHVELLKSDIKASKRREILARLQSGEIDLVIGTHALIVEDVKFHRLGLVVIDEQHRFGVGQRRLLKEKGLEAGGLAPHFLIMTATPIPRTLAMTAYGDLDVSVIRELPKGRIPITTRVVAESTRPKVYQFLSDQVAKGRQGYVIFPLVEESEKMDLKNAVDEFEKLKHTMPNLKFGLVHGRLTAEEKDLTMAAFKRGEINVLVSTTVIEVGVDVPNATMMIVEHAERFGLSQLHQIRGRVGRGEHKSYCVLVLGHRVSEESQERIQIMEKTADGFQIAEEDLKLRGPGNLLGLQQAGLPGFVFANLLRDTEILERARVRAQKIVEEDPGLESAKYKVLREQLNRPNSPIALAGIG